MKKFKKQKNLKKQKMNIFLEFKKNRKFLNKSKIIKIIKLKKD